MRKLLALLCMVVFLFGTALCEETQAIPPEDTIVEEVFEEEQVPLEEPILEEPLPVIEEDPPIESPPEEELDETPAEQPEEPAVEEPTSEEPIMEEPIEEEPIEELVKSEKETSETPTEVIEISEEVLTTPIPEPIEEEPIVEEQSENEIESEEIIVPEEIVEIAEGDWGYVDPEIIPREVHITFLNEPRYFGDEATIVATLVNFRSEDHYTLYWQYCIDVNIEDPEWITINGEHGRLYSFIVDKENYLYGYRVLIQMED